MQEMAISRGITGHYLSLLSNTNYAHKKKQHLLLITAEYTKHFLSFLTKMALLSITANASCRNEKGLFVVFKVHDTKELLHSVTLLTHQ